MNILIIDDDPEEFEFFHAAMEDLPEKFDIKEAHTCNDAIALLKGQGIDLIILDLNLGPESGIECLRTLRSFEWTNAIPIVMYSSSSSKNYVDECYEAKANFFFVKPSSITALKHILDKLIIINWLEPTTTARENFVIKP